MITCDQNYARIDTGKVSYVLAISESGFVMNKYFGPALPKDHQNASFENDAMKTLAGFTDSKGMSRLEFRPWGGADYLEPTLKISTAQGIRDTRLIFSDIHCESNGAQLRVEGEDSLTKVGVSLWYEANDIDGVIARWAEIKNCGVEPVTIEVLGVGELALPRASYRVNTVHGRWGGEFQLEQFHLPKGKHVLESRRGSTGHNANPWVVLDLEGRATEDSGTLWWAALGYSGNWKITLERDECEAVHITAAVNDFDFTYLLMPGEKLETPRMYVGTTGDGFGEMSRIMHRFVRNHVLPQNAQEERAVLYNSWEATYFDVTVDGQKRLADVARDIGVELFVVDDGWFSNRDDDTRGLGDWYVNTCKLPGGLEELIDYVNDQGMRFGLWVEPEMVNPDSELFRAHPDWVYNFPGREPTLMRNQLMLNMARPEVARHIADTIHDLLTRYNISFVKWDFNRNVSEPGGYDLGGARDKEIWMRHIEGLYSCVRELRQLHPDVVFQTCSGGGGRVDLGILRYFDQAWISDNTDAFDRLAIQHGYSWMYPAVTMESWVTTPSSFLNRREIPLRFRFHVAMCGVLGVGDDITRWNQIEVTIAKTLIRQYKGVRKIIHHGDLYRITGPDKGGSTIVAYVMPDRSAAVVFVFAGRIEKGDTRIRIPTSGLDPIGRYRFSADYDIPADMTHDSILLGHAASFVAQANGDYWSAMYLLERM